MEELRERCEAQRTAFRKNPPGYQERMSALGRLERALLQHKDDIIDAISEDFGGRPRGSSGRAGRKWCIGRPAEETLTR
jgi:acyl-CoA reductase-like NAD-dependent aldehyde dehydrogenase